MCCPVMLVFWASETNMFAQSLRSVCLSQQIVFQPNHENEPKSSPTQQEKQ
jgi:hypothetical protein